METQSQVLNGRPEMQSGNWKKLDISNLLVMVVWFGLLTGTVEGVASLVLQKLQWQSWTLGQAPSPENVWMCPAVDLVLAALAGLFVVVVAKMVSRVSATQLLVFLLSAMTFLNWLWVSGHVQQKGRIWSAAVAFISFVAAGRVTIWFGQRESVALSFCRKTLPGLAIVTVLAMGGITGGAWLEELYASVALPPVSSSKPPNVLVVVIDTLRADHLSAYGYPRPTSPNLDSLAQHGVLFNNAIASSSWTFPSHVSLLTGRFVYEHGSAFKPFDGRWPTLAQVVRSQGYVTAAFSVNTYFFSRRGGLGRGFVHFEDFDYSIADLIAQTTYGTMLAGKLRRFRMVKNIVRRNAFDLNRAALRWIDNHRDRPFLIFMNYLDVHSPYITPPSNRTRFSKSAGQDGLVDMELQKDWSLLTPRQQQDELNAYDDGIAYADSNLGALLAELKERGLTENTIIVVTADHGEGFGEHGLYLHGNSLYLELIRVPLVISGPPGLVPQGVRVEAPVSNVALAATLSDLLGFSRENTFRGPSLRESWLEPKSEPDDSICIESELISDLLFRPNPVEKGSLKSLVTPQWHYILNEKLRPELFDWRSDPREARNLIDSAAGQAVSASLKSRLESGCR